MEILQQIGAILGIAAFFGVALLVILYIVQARDVRRLRENAEFLVADPDAASELARAAEYRDAELARQAEERRERMRDRAAGAKSRLPAGRALVLVLVGALLLVAGIVFAVTRLGGGSGGGSDSITGAANVRVAVLNSTSEAGLAATYADRVGKLGYRVSPVGNSDQPFETSTVYFEPAGENAAGKVAEAAGIGVIEPISPEIRPQAGGAAVAVVLGADKAAGT